MKNKSAMLFRRYVWLIDTIVRNKQITYEEINEEWIRKTSLNPDGDDIPMRTFHNHINAIQEMFDINIVCDRRNGYVYSVEDNLPEQRNSIRTWMLNSMAINNMLLESRDLKKHILLEDIPSGQHHLSPIVEAIRTKNKLQFTYKSYWKSDSQLVVAEPYCLKLFKQRWYMLAIKSEAKDFRIYPLDRISDISTIDETYTIPQEFDAEAYFANFLGVLSDHEEDVQTVKIRVYNQQSNYLKSLPLHHSQQIIEETDNHVDFSYFITPTHDFIQSLLVYGHELEVLQPMWLREELLFIAEEMIKRYTNQ